MLDTQLAIAAAIAIAEGLIGTGNTQKGISLINKFLG